MVRLILFHFAAPYAHHRGSMSGNIYATYACVDRGLEHASEVFHTRQISYPLMVTVYRMLECHSMDIHPYPSSGVVSELGTFDHAEWCLFSVEVRNMYGTPFEVTIERTQEGLFLLFLPMALHLLG